MRHARLVLIGEALEVLKVLRADLEACRSETMPHGLSFIGLELIPARQAVSSRVDAAEGLRFRADDPLS